MATAVPEDFRGATISFSSSFLAKILDCNWDGISRQMMNTSTTDTTTAHTFKAADLFDPGGISVTMQLDATTKPPIAGAFETMTLSFPGGVPTTWACSAAMSDFAWSGSTGESDSITTATATLKFSGDITVT